MTTAEGFGVELSYVESAFFVADDGDPVVNVVFSAPVPARGEGRGASSLT